MNENNKLSAQRLPSQSLVVKPDEKATATTALEVFQSRNPSFGVLQKSASPEDAMLVIKDEVKLQMGMVWPNESLEVREMCAIGFTKHIFYDKPDWKVNDVSLFFRYLLREQSKGDNQQFRKLDLTYVALFIIQYEDYKAGEREKYHQSLKEATDSSNMMSGEVASHLSVMMDILQQVKVDNSPVKEETPKQETIFTRMQKLHNDWIRDFEKEVKENPVIINGMPHRFIRVGDKKLDLEEWLHHKQKEMMDSLT